MCPAETQACVESAICNAELTAAIECGEECGEPTGASDALMAVVACVESTDGADECYGDVCCECVSACDVDDMPCTDACYADGAACGVEQGRRLQDWEHDECTIPPACSELPIEPSDCCMCFSDGECPQECIDAPSECAEWARGCVCGLAGDDWDHDHDSS